MPLSTFGRKVFGDEKADKIYAYLKFFRAKFNNLKSLHYSEIIDKESIKVFEIPKHHVFFGYYDIQQLNLKEDKMLVHVVPKRSTIDRNKKEAEIGYFNVKSGEYFALTNTRTWCWQQGARLRWHPINDNYILFNDMFDFKYITIIWDVVNNCYIGQIDTALYDIDRQFSYGLSLNFSRLQRLRPGYGYDLLPDVTIIDHAPENDGVFLVDLQKNESRLIIKLRDLALDVDKSMEHQHYINHLSFAPDGNNFIFFHVWRIRGTKKWATRLYVAETLEANLKLLESNDVVSHYAWKNNEELLVTCLTKNKEQYYAEYNIISGRKRIVNQKILSKDGHPSFTPNSSVFISDTYPQKNEKQVLFVHNIIENRNYAIVELFSDPRYYGERRCDLHPRISSSGRFITIDSTFQDGLRKTVLVETDKIKYLWS